MDLGLATSKDATSGAALEAQQAPAASFAAGDQTVWADATGYFAAVCDGADLSLYVLLSCASNSFSRSLVAAAFDPPCWDNQTCLLLACILAGRFVCTQRRYVDYGKLELVHRSTAQE